MRIAFSMLFSTTVLVALSASAPAGEARVLDGFHPARGAPGDAVYLQGADLGRNDDVRFGDHVAPVVLARDGALVCRVPEGVPPGPVEIAVAGEAFTDRFIVLARGTPRVDAVSASLVTRGQQVLAHGRRLRGVCIALLDAEGRRGTPWPVLGGDRVAAFRVPLDAPLGEVRLAAFHPDRPEAAAEELTLEVRPHASPWLGASDPRTPVPGAPLAWTGADLEPVGTCTVRWEDRAGGRWERPGWSNGYDRLCTTVPEALPPDRVYRVRVFLGGEAEVDAGPVLVRRAAPPREPELTVTQVAGETVLIVGARGVRQVGGEVRVRVRDGSHDTTTGVLYTHLGGLGHGAAWIARLSGPLSRGTYDVEILTGGGALPAGTFRVEDAPRAPRAR